MSISVARTTQALTPIAVELGKPPAGLGRGAPPAASAILGSSPAAALSVSAQSKAYAIKHGHDPDSVQDGK